MELLEAKICAMIVLGISSMIFGLLPGWISHSRRTSWPFFMSTLLCFGGGVLMSTSLTHMLPEIRKTMPPNYADYTELIFCSGFFIVYMVDEIVHLLYGNPHNDIQSSVGSKVAKVERRHSFAEGRTFDYGATESAPLLRDPNPKGSAGKALSENDLALLDEPPSQICHVGNEEPCKSMPIGNIGLLIALIVHSVLEGLAVGLQNSAPQVLLLLGAISSHKLVVAFCLGTELKATGATSDQHFGAIVVFSSGSVAGIAVGMIVEKIPDNLLQVAFPILQGFAAGTLLYVTVSEILPRERVRWHKQHHLKIAGIIQYFSVLLGFIIMTAIGFCLDNFDQP